MDQFLARQGGPSFIHDGVNCVVCDIFVDGEVISTPVSGEQE